MQDKYEPLVNSGLKPKLTKVKTNPSTNVLQ